MAVAETTTQTLREALRAGIREELLANDRVVIFGQDEEDGGSFEVTEGLFEEFGHDRVRDTPISEAAEVGTGVGAAATGLRPIVNLSFSEFAAPAFDPIMNQMGKMRYMFGGASDVPLVVRAIEGGGLNAAAQHSGTIHTLFAHLPGIKVVAPGTPRGAKGLMKAAIRSDDPVMFFENKAIYEQEGPVPEDNGVTVPIGEARVVREGTDVTVVATQRLLAEARQVAGSIEEVDPELIDPQSLSPLDTDTILASLEKTGRLVVADESPLSCGFHAEILARAGESAFWALDAPFERVGVPDTPIPFSPPLENEVLPGAAEIRAAIDRVMPAGIDTV